MSSRSIAHDEVRANLHASTDAFLQAFHAGDTQALLPNASGNFAYHIHPATVKMQPMTRAGFLQFWDSFMAPNLAAFQSRLHTVSYDVENCRSVIHLSSTADTPLGKGTWNNEAMFICHFNEDGTLLTRVDELLDSAFLEDYAAKLKELENKKCGNRTQK